MSRLYKRGVKVTVYSQRLPNVSAFSSLDDVAPGFFDYLPDAVEITDLRVQFRVEKRHRKKASPNTCDVTITNLAASTRAEFQQPNKTVRLEAGYDDELRQVFMGDVINAYSHKNGADWETVLQLGDGSRAFRRGFVSKTFRAGVTVRTALREVAGSMGLTLDSQLEVTPELEDQFAAGLTLNGASRDELSRLLAPYGYEWSIQDGKLQVLRDGDVKHGASYLISRDTGLIGSPEYGIPERARKKRKPVLTFQTQLFPQLVPGGTVNVQSRAVNGTHKIVEVTHEGDTHGDPWTTEVKAK